LQGVLKQLRFELLEFFTIELAGPQEVLNRPSHQNISWLADISIDAQKARGALIFFNEAPGDVVIEAIVSNHFSSHRGSR
jgi:hypothetical protein